MSTNTDALVKALETVNSEYLSCIKQDTPEQRLGRRILNFKRNFPFHLLSWAKNIIKIKSTIKKSNSVSEYVSPEKMIYASPAPVEDKKGVVYTCITAGYDDPFEPILKSAALDYVLFTDKENQPADSVWNYRSIKGIEIKEGSNLANRYYKFHPHEFFSEYDYSIYIDGNVQIVSDVTGLYRVAQESPLGIAMHRHFARKCIQMEAKWCDYNNRGNREKLYSQVERYMQEGFPENFGLCEATIIVVDQKNETAKKIMTEWWEEFCRAGSGRDQIAFPYVLWKNGYSVADVGFLGNDEYQNPKFRINAHKGMLF